MSGESSLVLSERGSVRSQEALVLMLSEDKERRRRRMKVMFYLLRLAARSCGRSPASPETGRFALNNPDLSLSPSNPPTLRDELVWRERDAKSQF